MHKVQRLFYHHALLLWYTIPLFGGVDLRRNYFNFFFKGSKRVKRTLSANFTVFVLSTMSCEILLQASGNVKGR